MKTRITQTDIARVAGVHNTTVSLALRNCPAIPEPTRRKIRAVAEELGYHPDPALQALVAYRNGRTQNRRQETIAYVTHWTSRWGWQEMPAHVKFHAGAERKAAQCGFQLEHFWFGEPGMTQRRLSSVLYHRGITGVILASHRSDREAWSEMDWSKLSAIKIGCFPHQAALHRVIDDQTGVIRLAMTRILDAGYKRIGLVMPYWWDDCVDQAWSAGFLAKQYRLAEECRIPILWCNSTGDCSSDSDQVIDRGAFARWFKQYQPETIVSTAPFVRDVMNELGLSVPHVVAYVDLFLDGAERGVSGVQENSERVGEIAAELLIGQMQLNNYGLPNVATTTLVEGKWVEGESLPSLPAQGKLFNGQSATNTYDDNLLVPAL